MIRKNAKTFIENDMIYRECGKCKNIKKLEEFTFSKKHYMCRTYICRSCMCLVSRDLRGRKEIKERHKLEQRIYYKKYRYKQQARWLANARRDKLLKIFCEDCNDKKKEFELHHPDYKKSLDVITLCIACHAKRHRKGAYLNE